VDLKEGDQMNTEFGIKARKVIMPIIVIGFAFVVLTGCGIGHGQYRHGYNGYHGNGSRNDYQNSGYDDEMNGPDGRVYHRRMSGNGDGRREYCGW
jgi:hypothetical protein